MPPVLSDDDRDALFLMVRDQGPLADGTWRDALSALLPAYRFQLPDAAAPGTQVFPTVVALNNAGRLINGTIPLDVVLQTLGLLSTVASVTELAKILRAKADGKMGMAPLPAYTPAAGEPEAYTGTTDDTLPFDFLRAGLDVGSSVVKLVVPRFEHGQAAVGPQGPRTFNGTGWLIAKELLVTNFHVVCARESDEDDPTPADLQLQIAGTLCHFAYDRDGATPVTIPVVAGVTWGARGGPRDYAVVRVAPTPAWPSPLRLRRQPPSVPKEGYSVNIIQHPAGLPKRVAARANLLKSATAELLEYFGDTLGGSSGSPLCNDAWEVIGLHRASGPATNVFVKGKPAAAHNVGIPIDAILTDLQAQAPPIFAEVAASILP